MSGYFIAGRKSENKADCWSHTCQYVHDSRCICNPAVSTVSQERSGNGGVRIFYGKRCAMAFRAVRMGGKMEVRYLDCRFLGIYRLSIPAVSDSEAAPGEDERFKGDQNLFRGEKFPNESALRYGKSFV